MQRQPAFLALPAVSWLMHGRGQRQAQRWLSLLSSTHGADGDAHEMILGALHRRSHSAGKSTALWPPDCRLSGHDHLTHLTTMVQGTLVATDVHAGRLQKLAQAAAAQGLSNVKTQAVDLCDLAVGAPTRSVLSLSNPTTFGGSRACSHRSSHQSRSPSTSSLPGVRAAQSVEGAPPCWT